MARSQLLKDIVTGKEDIESVLLRLKVILSDLNNDSINEWVKSELEGYDEDSILPSYRVVEGNPKGTFVVNYRTQNTNSYIPLDHLLKREEIKELTTVKITDNIGTLYKVLSKEGNEYGKLIPTSYCYSISIPTLQILSMIIEVPQNILSGVTSSMKSKLVDIVMELEKEFENLDELDISSQIKEKPGKAEQITYNVEKIIFDGSIKLGDGNKVKNSGIGRFFGGGMK